MSSGLSNCPHRLTAETKSERGRTSERVDIAGLSKCLAFHIICASRDLFHAGGGGGGGGVCVCVCVCVQYATLSPPELICIMMGSTEQM